MSGSFRSLSLRLTHHVSLLRVPNLHPQGACLLLFFSKVSRFLRARGVLEAVSRQTGLWDFRDQAGTRFTVRTPPLRAKSGRLGSPLKNVPSPQNKPADWRVSWAHWFLFFLFVPCLIHFPTGAVEQWQFIYCPLNQTQMGWYSMSNTEWMMSGS